MGFTRSRPKRACSSVLQHHVTLHSILCGLSTAMLLFFTPEHSMANTGNGPGNYLIFDGLSDYIDCGSNASLNIETDTAISIETWFNPSSTNGLQPIVGSDEYLFAFSTNHLLFYPDTSGTSIESSSFAFHTGTWYHAAVCYHYLSGEYCFYINGMLYSNGTFSATTQPAGTVFIACDAALSTFFDGGLDEIRIWNTTRTHSDIQDSMHYNVSGYEPCLSAYYRFDELSGTNATDLSTNTNTGILSGSLSDTDWTASSAPIYAINAGNCLEFDGVNDYAALNGIAPFIAGKTHFTIEWWVKGLASAQTRQASMLAVNTAAGGNAMIIFMGYSSVKDGLTHVYDGVTDSYEITGSYIGDNQWHHIAYIRSNTVGTLYTDGVLNGAHTANYTFLSSDQWSLGQEFDNTTPGDYFAGCIDEFRIWSTNLTQSDIHDIMNRSPHDNPDHLLAMYCMDQISGTNVLDTAINNLIGELRNMDDTDWIPSTARIHADGPGNALTMTGSDEAVFIPDDPALTRNVFTIECWFQWDGQHYSAASFKDWACLLSKGAYNNGEFCLLMQRDSAASDNTFNFYLNGGLRTSYTHPGLDTSWHYLSATYNQSTAAIYLDGKQVSSDIYSSAISDSGYALIPGQQGTGNGYNWGGSIDHLRFWKNVRTESEIQSDFHRNISSANTNLVAAYSFDYCTGTNLYDFTTNHHDGVLSNFATSGSSNAWIRSSAPVADYTAQRYTNLTAFWCASNNTTVAGLFIQAAITSDAFCALGASDSTGITTNDKPASINNSFQRLEREWYAYTQGTVPVTNLTVDLAMCGGTNLQETSPELLVLLHRTQPDTPFSVVTNAASRTNELITFNDIMLHGGYYTMAESGDIPVIIITNPPDDMLTVSSAVTHYAISGIINSDVIGLIAWTNSLTGSNAQQAASNPWNITNIYLGIG